MFLVQNYAAIAESNGDNDQAISVLESYIASGNKVFLTKAYLDLGRLYILKNDQTRAKKNLDYIIANHPNDELAKLARLYLQRMNPTP
jgi:Tfp pilus assembly protein PilF